MKSFDFLFWKNGEISTLPSCSSLEVPEAYHELFCVDLAFLEGNPKMRYGKFTPSGWRAIPLELFPAEFRTTLLLLGI